MRSRTLLTLIVVFALLAAACGDGEDTTAAPSPTTTGQSPTATQTGRAATQELVVAYGEDQFAKVDIDMKRLAMYPYNFNVCEPLLRLNEGFGLDPVLASSLPEYVGDNTFRFSLREGVAFHNGQPLDADAVKYTIDYTVQEPSTGYSSLVEDSARVVDEMSVDIRPGEPNLRLPEQIQHPTYAILAPGSDPLNNQDPVCTGPFKLTEYVPNDHATVVRNEDYWGEPAQLDKITFRFIPDPSTRALALQSGEVDVIADVERAQADSLAETSGLKVVNAPPGQVILSYLALRGPDGEQKVTSDLAVRQSIAHAFDRQSYVEGVLDGNAEVVTTVNPPSVLGDHASKVTGLDHEPDRARQILEEAGWTVGSGGVRQKDGQELDVRMIFHPARITQPTAEFFQALLEDVGFDVEIIPHADTGAYRETLNAGEWEINIEAPNQNDANPAFLLALRWYSNSTVPSVPFVAPGGRYDELISQILQEPDLNRARELAADAMHVLVDEEVAVVPMAGTFRVWAMKDTVEGFMPHPSGINQRWDTVYVTE